MKLLLMFAFINHFNLKKNNYKLQFKLCCNSNIQNNVNETIPTPPVKKKKNDKFSDAALIPLKDISKRYPNW